MKKVFRVLLVLAIAAAVLGYFRNWYTVSRVNEEQKTKINVTIDRQRIKEDLDLATKKAQGVTNRIRGQESAEGATSESASDTKTLSPPVEQFPP